MEKKADKSPATACELIRIHEKRCNWAKKKQTHAHMHTIWKTRTHIHKPNSGNLTLQTIWFLFCVTSRTRFVVRFDSPLIIFFSLRLPVFDYCHSQSNHYYICWIFSFIFSYFDARQDTIKTWQNFSFSRYFQSTNTQHTVYFVCVAKRIERILSELFYCLYGNREKSINNYCAICVNVVYERPLSFSAYNHFTHIHVHIHTHNMNEAMLRVVLCCVVLSVWLLFLLLFLLQFSVSFSFIFCSLSLILLSSKHSTNSDNIHIMCNSVAIYNSTYMLEWWKWNVENDLQKCIQCRAKSAIWL